MHKHRCADSCGVKLPPYDGIIFTLSVVVAGEAKQAVKAHHTAHHTYRNQRNIANKRRIALKISYSLVPGKGRAVKLIYLPGILPAIEQINSCKSKETYNNFPKLYLA